MRIIMIKYIHFSLSPHSVKLHYHSILLFKALRPIKSNKQRCLSFLRVLSLR